MPWKTAEKYLTRREDCTICDGTGVAPRGPELGECLFCDGLEQRWDGRVWMNPPFGQQAAAWLRKLAGHGNGIALIPARTETAMFYESVWSKADAVCFAKGRPHFHYADGTRAPFNSGAPIALVAYGQNNVDALLKANLGVTLLIRPTPNGVVS